jgi:hypothetical protein
MNASPLTVETFLLEEKNKPRHIFFLLGTTTAIVQLCSLTGQILNLLCAAGIFTRTRECAT